MFSNLSTGKQVFKMKTPQTSVLFGHPGLKRNNEDFFALRIANYILGGGVFNLDYIKILERKKVWFIQFTLIFYHLRVMV